ncbi:hypothetical protein D7027_14415 [Ochrobactrum intermedium]|nr:hypothetical protein [Brucella intermedia]
MTWAFSFSRRSAFCFIEVAPFFLEHFLFLMNHWKCSVCFYAHLIRSKQDQKSVQWTDFPA